MSILPLPLVSVLLQTDNQDSGTRLAQFEAPQSIEPLVQVQSREVNDDADLSLTKEEKALSGYSKVLELLSSDPVYQKDVTLGKRIGFYKIGKELGSGNFSKVKMGLHVLTKERVAIKIMEKTKMDQKSQKLLEREILSMEQMHHPNIVRLFEVMETLSKLYFVIEYAPGGELYTKVIDEGRLKESEVKPVYAQILSAVIHMHEKAIIHRDIKAENVFFAAPGWIKLGDFGFSVEIEPGQSLNTFCGSPPYAAPELFRDMIYQGEYVDIWALGILLYFCVTGNTPFRGDTVAELKRQILDGFFTIPDYVTPFCQDLINGILRMDPLSRYTLTEIEQHYWLGHTKFPEAYTQFSLTPNDEEMRVNPVMGRVRDKVRKYGITDQMLQDAADKGAKNSVNGTYRILLFQEQQQEVEELRQRLEMDDAGASRSINSQNLDEKENRRFLYGDGKKSRFCTIV